MKIKGKASVQKKRKISKNPTDPALDTTLQNIFQIIDQHYDNHSHANKSMINSEDSSHSAPSPAFGQKRKKVRMKKHVPQTETSNTSASCVTVNRTALKEALRILSEDSKPDKSDINVKSKLKFRFTCQEGCENMADNVNWQSASFIARVIRNLILNREWNYLKDMLRILMKQKKIMKNYVKEITYLYFLINADQIDPEQFEDYFLQCFATCDPSKKPFKEFDIWFKQDASLYSMYNF